MLFFTFVPWALHSSFPMCSLYFWRSSKWSSVACFLYISLFLIVFSLSHCFCLCRHCCLWFWAVRIFSIKPPNIFFLLNIFVCSSSTICPSTRFHSIFVFRLKFWKRNDSKNYSYRIRLTYFHWIQLKDYVLISRHCPN